MVEAVTHLAFDFTDPDVLSVEVTAKSPIITDEEGNETPFTFTMSFEFGAPDFSPVAEQIAAIKAAANG